MRTAPITGSDWQGVVAVPPLARRSDSRRTFDWNENARIVAHLHAGGVTRLLYGGNAFLYHVTLGEYEEILGWLSQLDDALWAIPSVGPSYGRMMDQAAMLKRSQFPCAMHLPCSDPRDAQGLEAGLREFVEASGIPLILYLKEEHNFGTDREAGLDVVARLVSDKLCVGIKYAVVRADPGTDTYLAGLLGRVDRGVVISGIGERPAIVHMRDFGLPGFTTGSGCVAPILSQKLFDACTAGSWEQAEIIRAVFLALEDFRDAHGPARVLHSAVELGAIAASGPIPPFLTGLSEAQRRELRPVAEALLHAARDFHTRELDKRSTVGNPS